MNPSASNRLSSSDATPFADEASTSTAVPAGFSLTALVLPGACILLLCVKGLLIWRINFNWDEFYYLSQIYAAGRGAGAQLFQSLHVDLLAWLRGLGSDEIDQLIVGRMLAWLCLAVSVVLIARLAARWTSAHVAWLAPLAYLAASPVLRHGASFRVDAWLVPLSVAILLLLTRIRAARNLMLAGALFGIAFAFTVKAVLLMPLFLLLLIGTSAGETESRRGALAAVVRCTAIFGAAAAAMAITVLFLHWLTLPHIASGAAQTFAGQAVQKTLLDVPLFPRWDYFERTLGTDRVTWLFVLGGFVVALRYSRRAAACALSLLPLVFYRNAFPYYYIVLLAPAVVLVAVGADFLVKAVERSSRSATAAWVPLVISLPLCFQAVLNLEPLRYDRQEFQRLTVAAVHAIFPEPVPYVDHSGMISSFPKVNFFMSTWGIESYRERGEGFMQRAVEADRAPMVLTNSAVLLPGTEAFDFLFAEDRQYIERSYLPYWGAIRIAGAETLLEPGAVAALAPPIPGSYRVEASEPVILINDREVSNGEEVDYTGSRPLVAQAVGEARAAGLKVRLIWAAARPAPSGSLPASAPLYSPF